MDKIEDFFYGLSTGEFKAWCIFAVAILLATIPWIIYFWRKV